MAKTRDLDGALALTRGHSSGRTVLAGIPESDGVDGEHGLGLIWPATRIEADNPMFRIDATFARLYMPFEAMLFFADARQRRSVRVCNS